MLAKVTMFERIFSFQLLPLPRGLGLNVVGGMGSGKGEGGLFLRFKLVYILIYYHSYSPTEPRVLRKVCVVGSGGGGV